MPRRRRLVHLDHGLWLLELFHGPTLAFKEEGLQLLGLLFEAVLAPKYENHPHTLLAPRQAIMGSAALDACRNREAISTSSIFIRTIALGRTAGSK